MKTTDLSKLKSLSASIESGSLVVFGGDFEADILLNSQGRIAHSFMFNSNIFVHNTH
jgi:hypothetical protein